MTQRPDSYFRAEQAQRELTEQEHLGILSLEISVALSEKETLHDMLTACTEALVRHLAAPLVRIWLRAADKDELELWASAGSAQFAPEHTRLLIQPAAIAAYDTNNTPGANGADFSEAARIASQRTPYLLDLQASNQDTSTCRC